MEKKKIQELIMPYTRTDTIVMVLISLVVLVLNIWAGIACLLCVVLVNFFHAKITAAKLVKTVNEMRAKAIKENEEITRNFIDCCPVFMCVSTAAGQLSWVSEGFREEITDGENLEGILSTDDLVKLFENESYQTIIDYKENKYCVTASSRDESSHSTRMLYFEDVTSSEIVRALFRDSRPCLAYIHIDNYDELMSASPVENQSKIVADIETIVKTWADEVEGSFTKIKKDQFAVLFEHRHIDKLREEQFSIMEKVHGIETEADFPTTISIGLGMEASNFMLLQEYAYEAMDLALGRGGDQAVIKTASADLEYFGGGLANVERRNKGKARIMSHALLRLIKDADKVLIMGHARPDMDALGSAIGVAALAMLQDKKAYIVLNDPGDGVDLLFDEAKKTERFEFISDEIAMSICTQDTLLIIVDTHIGPMTECPALLDKCKKLVVIDHHRKSANAIENTLLTYMEPYASSASEQVCELIQYAGNFEFGKFEMDALLAGITLDTKNFTQNTGARTFESASWLRRNGANTRNVMNFFKMRLDFFQKKVNMIASAEVLGNGICVAYTKDSDPYMNVLTGQTADELLEMRDIDAVFVAGSLGEKGTTVSARSNGQFNVQVIMEKLGGGGHINSAAVQLSESPEEAIQKIVQVLREEDKL